MVSPISVHMPGNTANESLLCHGSGRQAEVPIPHNVHISMCIRIYRIRIYRTASLYFGTKRTKFALCHIIHVVPEVASRQRFHHGIPHYKHTKHKQIQREQNMPRRSSGSASKTLLWINPSPAPPHTRHTSPPIPSHATIRNPSPLPGPTPSHHELLFQDPLSTQCTRRAADQSPIQQYAHP